MIHTTASFEHMQFDTTKENKSHFRLIGYLHETERQSPKPDAQPPKIERKETPLIVPHKHQRIHTLVLSARQVQDQGGLPGQANPYLPRAPSLFRDTFEDKEIRALYRPSPLQNLAFTNYSPRANKQRTTIKYCAKPGVQPFTMPHAVSMPQTGFQALILCGPGVGLGTFTSVPQEYPKALVPIANRPMIWYVLDWCYRMGVTDITIITPPASKAPIEAALGQNPDLTALPSPKPDLLAPRDLEFNTPTAELLRLPEVQEAIKSDFLLLPCDLVCDVAGDALLESYLTSMGGFAGMGPDFEDPSAMKTRDKFSLGSEGSGRRGGLSIWYNTANREESVKKEECDFMGTVTLDSHHKAPLQKVSNLPEGRLRKLVYTTPMSELLEEAEENKSWKVRQSLLRKYGAVKCMTQYRDSHIYFLPFWVKEFATQNEDFESISEDLIGTWAKSEWRNPSYRAEFGADKIFKKRTSSTSEDNELRNRADRPIEEEIDLLSLSSTQVAQNIPNATALKKPQPVQLASRVQANPQDSILSVTTDDSRQDGTDDIDMSFTMPQLPPILSYVLTSATSAPLVRRVDTTPLLLSVSLLLAKLPSLEQASAAPFSHPTKIHPTSQPPQGVRVSISQPDTLVGPNVTLSAHIVLKGSCIGSNCTIGAGARITGCVIMDGAQIGEKAVLTGCVVGKKAVVGKNSQLRDCEIQDGFVVKDGTEAKNEKYLIGGFEGDEDDMEFGEGGNDVDED